LLTFKTLTTMKKHPFHFVVAAHLIFILFIVSCNSSTDQVSDQGIQNEKYLVLSPEEYHALLLTKGELMYVPIYSEIFGANLDKKIQLSATLSIRNISMDSEIIVSKVDFYDTHGTLIRHYIKNAVKLKPLETISYLVEYKDSKGGDGANFIVEWVSEKEVVEPIIEAVMIGASSALGISFTCQGKVIKYLNE